MVKITDNQDYDSEETRRRATDALKRELNTPHKPHSQAKKEKKSNTKRVP